MHAGRFSLRENSTFEICYFSGGLHLLLTQVSYGGGYSSVLWDQVAGNITFSPSPDFVGTAQFSYSITDGVQTVSEAVIVDVTVDSSLAGTEAGTALGEAIVGGGEDDRLFGMAGDDTLQGGRGDDLLNGGKGMTSLKEMPVTTPMFSPWVMAVTPSLTPVQSRGIPMC